MNAPSHAGLPRAILVTCGFDMLRDVGHAYAQKLAAAGNDITYVHYPELPHGFIQMTAHSRRRLDATQELAGLLGEALRKPSHPTTDSHSTGRRHREPVAE
jgi:acetyl esterase